MRTILSDDIIDFGVKYVLGEKVEFNDSLFENLFLSYLGDLNSSTLREAITCKIIGCKWSSEKLGDDGYDTTSGLVKEIKPKFVHGEKKSNGSGTFNDYTHARLDAHIEKNTQVVVSLFTPKYLIYVIEFPIKTIEKTLREKIIKSCDEDGNKWCRNASFSYKDYMYSEETKILFLNYNMLNLLKCVNKNFLSSINEKLMPSKSVIDFIL
jgi:hypothetical protein